MTATERKKLQRDFLRRVGPNAETFKALFDTLPDATFYMMDDQDRIMAYNRRNCENSNIRSEAEIVGRKSSEVFPAVLAEVYMARDREVRDIALYFGVSADELLGLPPRRTDELRLTPIERHLLEKFRFLDRRGQSMVRHTIENEYDFLIDEQADAQEQQKRDA